MLEEKGISPTPVIYTTVLDYIYKRKKSEEAELLWNEMVKTGCNPDNATYNARIFYHGLQTETDKVPEVIKEMEKAGVNISQYNHI